MNKVTGFLAACLVTAGVGCTSALPNCVCALRPNEAGCGAPQFDYLLIEAQFTARMGQPRKIEISDTPVYRERREQVPTAAIRLPDNCLNETAAQVKGDARSTQEIAKTSCGVWLSELEKALVHANFRVVSWDALHGLQENKHIPAFDAAKSLGADVLFMFNSLEATNIEPGADSTQRIEYYRSNAEGGKGPPHPLVDQERAGLRVVVRQKAGDWVQEMAKKGASALAISATLDSTAIDTRSGESMWFYRNSTVKPVKGLEGRAFLFVKHLNQWHLAKRRAEAIVPVVQVPTTSAVDFDRQDYAATRDPYAADRLELVRSIAQDFVTRFRSGAPGETAGGSK